MSIITVTHRLSRRRVLHESRAHLKGASTITAHVLALNVGPKQLNDGALLFLTYYTITP